MNKIGILVGFLCCIVMGTANASSISVSGSTSYDLNAPRDADGQPPITSHGSFSVNFGALNINDDVNTDPNIYEFTNVFMNATVNLMEFVGGSWRDASYHSSSFGNYLRIENDRSDQYITLSGNGFSAHIIWSDGHSLDTVSTIHDYTYYTEQAQFDVSPFIRVPEPNTLVLLLTALLVLFFVNHFKINRSNR